MKGMSIGARLSASYGLLIAIGAVVGWLCLNRVEKINVELESIAADNSRKAQLLHSAATRVHANSQLTLQSFLAEDRAAFDSIQVQIENNKKEITRLIRSIEADKRTSTGDALLAAVKRARAPYVASFTRVKTLLAANHRAQAMSVAINEMGPSLAKFNQAWDAFAVFQVERLNSAIKESRASYIVVRRRMVIIVLFAVALAAFVAILVTQGIVLPLKTLSNTMTTIMKKKDLSQRVALPMGGEIGALATSFNLMLGALAEQDARDISERTSSERRKAARRAAFLINSKEDNITTIVQGVLQSLGEALLWRQGAYWVLDEDAGKLRCAAFWNHQPGRPGAFEEVSRKTAFSPGVGLPGRVWEHRAPSWIEDVTKDGNFPRAPFALKEGLHAALGFPVMIEGKVHGVLEFFSDKIEKPDDELLQMMATAGEQLGFFIQHKRTEEALRKSKLYQSEKMAAVGQLAAGVAHEINNPLGIILGFAQSAVKRIKDPDPLLLPLKSIEREALRCRTLVQDLLVFSRENKNKIEDCDMNETVSSTVGLVEAQAKVRSIEILKELGPITPILGDKNQLQQTIVNLCSNAMDAMPQGGKIIIRTRKNLMNGVPWLLLEIEDTGTGIPEEIQDKIFHPFFTTKEVGKGTGLGLSLVYEIVQRHRGTIQVRSKVGEGTVFTISLPAKDHMISEKNKNHK